MKDLHYLASYDLALAAALEVDCGKCTFQVVETYDGYDGQSVWAYWAYWCEEHDPDNWRYLIQEEP